MGTICHIVPATPPEMNGVGDYARQLFRHWPEPKPDWRVAALRVPPCAKEAWPGVTFHPFQPNALSLTEALQRAGADTIALHYVGHGYHPKGIPLWLPEALAEWKHLSGGSMVTFFHELFAFSQPWRTAFWLAPSAITLLRKVCRLSDAAMTSNALYARQLHVYGGYRKPVRVAEIPSNIDPPVELGAKVFEPPYIVAIFGQSGTRRSSLEQGRRFLKSIQASGTLSKIVLIGSKGSTSEVEVAERFGPVECHFDATEKEISDALSQAHFGLTNVDWKRIGKSGVVAALLAHRVIPVAAHGKPAYCLSGVNTLPDTLRKPSQMAPTIAAMDLQREQRTWENTVAAWSASLT